MHRDDADDRWHDGWQDAWQDAWHDDAQAHPREHPARAAARRAQRHAQLAAVEAALAARAAAEAAGLSSTARGGRGRPGLVRRARGSRERTWSLPVPAGVPAVLEADTMLSGSVAQEELSPRGQSRWPWVAGAVGGAALAGLAVVVARRLLGDDAPGAQEPEQLRAVVDLPPAVSPVRPVVLRDEDGEASRPDTA